MWHCRLGIDMDELCYGAGVDTGFWDGIFGWRSSFLSLSFSFPSSRVDTNLISEAAAEQRGTYFVQRILAFLPSFQSDSHPRLQDRSEQNTLDRRTSSLRSWCKDSSSKRIV